jgi:hypothetical protein
MTGLFRLASRYFVAPASFFKVCCCLGSQNNKHETKHLRCLTEHLRSLSSFLLTVGVHIVKPVMHIVISRLQIGSRLLNASMKGVGGIAGRNQQYTPHRGLDVSWPKSSTIRKSLCCSCGIKLYGPLGFIALGNLRYKSLCLTVKFVGLCS